MKQRQAFTLIELSIVLVIIGLIVGGVLVGQDMIRQAQIRSMVKQSQEVFTKVNAFRLKYDALPGEFLQYQQFFSTLVGPYCKNPTFQGSTINGIIDDTYEYAGAMAQLHAAGMIEMGKPQILQDGTVLDHYDCRYNNQLSDAAFTTPWSNIWSYFQVFDAHTSLLFGDTDNPVLTVSEALALDQKLDDGLPYNGRMRGRRTSAAGYCTSDSNENNKAATYDSGSLSKKTCQIIFSDGI